MDSADLIVDKIMAKMKQMIIDTMMCAKVLNFVILRNTFKKVEGKINFSYLDMIFLLIRTLRRGYCK